MNGINACTCGHAQKEHGNIAKARQIEQTNHPLTGKTVLVRTYSAGLHFGTLAQANGKLVHLTNSRRVWNWTGGALSCSEIATKGITGGKIAVEVPAIFLTEAIEIIPMSAEAEKCLRSY